MRSSEPQTALHAEPSDAYQRFRQRLLIGLASVSTLAIAGIMVEIAMFGSDGASMHDDKRLLIGASAIFLILAVVAISAHLALRSFARIDDRQQRYRLLYDSSRAVEAKLSDSEKRLRLITDNLPVMMGYLDRGERFTSANRAYETFFGLDAATIPGKLVSEVLGPEIYAIAKPHLDKALAGTAVTYERHVTRLGRKCWDRVSYLPDIDASGNVAGIFLMAEDITARKKSEESMMLASMVYDYTSEGMMITEPDGTIVTVNPAFARLTGYTMEEVIGRHSSDLTSTRHEPEFFDAIRATLARTGQWHGEVWNTHKDGTNFLISIVFNTVFDENGKPFRRIALFSDITAKKATEELIWKQANFDALTGLANRRMFQERLRQEMKKSDRSELAMALLFLDLDHFKAINDTLGHDMGDVLLKEAAQRLSVCVRGTDTVARLGGDEFTVILSELTNPADVVRIAHDILRRMAEPFKLGTEQGFVTASIGITLYPADGATIEVLLKNADQAMYAAKQQGRNRFNYFAPFMQDATRIRTMLTNELQDAVAKDQLRVVYQPIIELVTGKIQKAEALVRWQHPLRGLLTPGEFIAIAETSGVIVNIGDWVFRHAARQAKRMQDLTGAPFQISVNKSALQFRDNGSQYTGWFQYMQEIGLHPSAMTIEVTEDLLQDASHFITDKLLVFRDVGMQISLDDFGTGHTSLSFLKKFDIDYLKIDPSFIANLSQDADALMLCEAMIAMAHKLGMKVVAEGIETEEQSRILKLAGCDLGQGFLFSKPVKAHELEQMLRPGALAVDN